MEESQESGSISGDEDEEESLYASADVVAPQGARGTGAESPQGGQ